MARKLPSIMRRWVAGTMRPASYNRCKDKGIELERFVGLGTLPLHVPSLAVTELERCMGDLRLKGSPSRPWRERWSSVTPNCERSGPMRKRSAPSSTSIPAAIAIAASSAFISGTALGRPAATSPRLQVPR